MKNILFNANGTNNYSEKRLQEEAKKLNINLVKYWEIDEDLDYVATLNRRYLNNLIALQRGKQINRMIDGIFWKNKIPQLTSLPTACQKPKFLIGKNLDFHFISNTLDLPFIAKMSQSCQGKGVYLIKNISDFKEAIDCDIFEEVIWNSYGKDVRVYSIQGEVRCCMLRENKSNFKSNFHQGGRGTDYPINDNIKNIAKEIYKYTNLDVVGIDLLLNKNEYIFCELNTNPGFEELERACNYNAPAELLKLCIE